MSVGKYEYNNGDIYEGEWKDWAREGDGKSKLTVGICEYANKDKYKGQWHDDKKEGNGSFLRKQCRSDGVWQWG